MINNSSTLLVLRKLTPLTLYSGRGVGGEGLSDSIFNFWTALNCCLRKIQKFGFVSWGAGNVCG